MNRYLQFRVLFSFLFLIAYTPKANSQCTNNIYGSWGSLSPVCNGTFQNATTGGWAGEYSPITVVAGNNYTFQSSVATDIVTITTTGSAVLAWGTGTVVWTANFSGTVWFWTHLPGCNGEIASRTRRVMCGAGSCIHPFAFGSNPAPTTCATPTTNFGVWAGEYTVFTNAQNGITYQFSSSVATDWLVITNNANVVLASGTSPVNYTPNFTGEIRVHVSTSNACGTQNVGRNITATRTAPCLPPDPTSASASNTTICSGESTTLTAGGVVGTVYWFEGSCATTGQVGTGSPLVVSPTSTTTYYARNFSGGQWSDGCASVTVTVNLTPAPPSAPGVTICGPNSASLTASGSTGDYNWYSDAAGNNLVGTGPNYTTPVLVANTTYYVGAAGSGASCAAGSATLLGGSYNSNATWITPFSTFWEDTRRQYIVTAAELTAAGFCQGNIIALSLTVNSLGLPATLTGFNIRIRNTASATLGGFEAGTTTVWSGNYNPFIGVNTFNFSTPHFWDGTSNIL